VSHEFKRGGSSVASGSGRSVTGSAPGKRTLTEALPAGAPVQRKPTGAANTAPEASERHPETVALGSNPFATHLLFRGSGAAAVQQRASGPAAGEVHAAAARGIDGPATGLPFANQIQASFGPRHDVAAIQSHVGGPTAEAAMAMGASAYATGNHVVFAGAMFWQLLHFSIALPRYAPPASPGTGGGVGAPGTGATVTPHAGQLLFYHSGGSIPAHVAVSLGGDQAISLWNQPNNIASVQRIQVTAISGTIYVGDPPW
jgi:Domain of unknown function (DUF4157)